MMTEEYIEILKTREFEKHRADFADAIIKEANTLRQSPNMPNEGDFPEFFAEEGREFTALQIFNLPKQKGLIAAAMILSFTLGMIDTQGFEQEKKKKIFALDEILSEGVVL